MKDNGKMNKKATKAQSAMEYLMTYGWAILIIAVVLAALDLLGVFNGSAFIGTACLATPGYTCSNPIMANTGTLSYTFTQSTGSTLYNVAFACAATSNSSGYPFEGAGNLALFTNANSLGPNSENTLASGATISVAGLNCYNSKGGLASGPIGTAFGGTIYMNYTSTAGGAPLVAPIAKVTVKVS